MITYRGFEDNFLLDTLEKTTCSRSPIDLSNVRTEFQSAVSALGIAILTMKIIRHVNNVVQEL